MFLLILILLISLLLCNVNWLVLHSLHIPPFLKLYCCAKLVVSGSVMIWCCRFVMTVNTNLPSPCNSWSVEAKYLPAAVLQRWRHFFEFLLKLLVWMCLNQTTFYHPQSNAWKPNKYVLSTFPGIVRQLSRYRWTGQSVHSGYADARLFSRSFRFLTRF